MSEQTSIVIAMPMVWSVRNIVYGGVLDSLASRGIKVHLLMKRLPTRQNGLSEVDLFANSSSCDEMIHHQPHTSRVAALLGAVVKEAFFYRAGMRSLRLSTSWYQRDASSKTKLRTRFVQAVGSILGRSKAFPSVRQWYQGRWLRRYSSGAVRNQIQSLNPTCVWLTVWGLAGEETYFAAARELGIPVVASIMGFDNPFTQGFRPRFDRYLVWSQAMKEAVMRLDPELCQSAVAITGTPQFDFHRRDTMLWGRSKIYTRLGIPNEGHYFLYAANHPSHTPDEPTLLRRLVDRLVDDEQLRCHRIVVRLHPLDRTGRWDQIDGYRDRVVLSSPFDPACDEDGWSVSSPEDQALLVSSLRHADACINIASTIALDAAILDCPTISLELSAEPDSQGGIFYSEYSSEYYRQLVDSGGLSIAHSWDQVNEMLRQAVEYPERGREGRRAMVRTVCGDVDGKAADRVAEDLHDFVTFSRGTCTSSENKSGKGFSDR